MESWKNKDFKMTKYSIIVPTYNRLHEIKEFLEFAQNLDFPRNLFELIIVDDGSTDKTEEFLRKINSSLDIKTIFQKNLGPSMARNNGMENASGQYFLFVDSDCLLPSLWLKKIDNFLKRNNVDAFGGPDDFHNSFSVFLKAIDYSMTSFLFTGGTRSGITKFGKFYPRSFNMGIKRQVWEKIGGMGNLRHGQDIEYSARIYRSKFKVAFINSPVYHKRRTDLKKFFKQIFNFGNTRINLAKTDKKLLRPIHFLPCLSMIFFFCLTGYAIIASNFFILKYIAFFASFMAVIIFFQSLVKYKNFIVSILAIVTTFVQVLAYGMGFITGIVQILFSKKATGFTKNYYK